MVSSNTAEVLPVQTTSRKRPNLVLHRKIVGKSSSIRKVFSLIERVCDTDSTVLIQGESGTGKELIAQALHYSGDRSKKPFVPVNCGAIPAELLESELFGHEKGAFTHAIRTRIGRFEMADKGTVFLDEIAEMSPVLQVKLLRVLQEKQFERVGGTKTISSDFRVIAATNQNLEDAVANGTFREDLYYRLTVIPITSPPLRERRGDIPLLFDTFLKRFCLSKKRELKGISAEAMIQLKNYDWPGNVRELENMVERMVILTIGNEITLEDLPPRIYDAQPTNETPAITEIPDTGFCLSKVLAAYEKKLIIRALEQTGWVKNRAAKLIQVNRTTLLEKMKRHGVTKPA
jgi:transcriptional regulator with GAF, ATPase, and Fis domain